MRDVSDKSGRENQNTLILCSITPPPPENRAFFLDNMEKYGRARQATDDNIIRRRKMRFACRNN
jgi:hypothetical protein